MASEPIRTDPDGVAEVWRAAQQRRAGDISGWVFQWFKRRRLKLADERATSAKAHPALGSAKARRGFARTRLQTG